MQCFSCNAIATDAPIVAETDSRRGVVSAPSPDELARQEQAKKEAYDTFANLLGGDLLGDDSGPIQSDGDEGSPLPCCMFVNFCFVMCFPS